VTRYPRLVVLATVVSAICFPIFAVFGVIFLTEGDIANGLTLLGCVAVGVPTLLDWRRRFR
jgi:predicted Na+-dependent transporter